MPTVEVGCKTFLPKSGNPRAQCTSKSINVKPQFTQGCHHISKSFPLKFAVYRGSAGSRIHFTSATVIVVFTKKAKIDNNDKTDIRGFHTRKNKIQQQIVTQVSIEPGTKYLDYFCYIILLLAR